MKRAFFSIVMLISALVAWAQIATVHTVSLGETIEGVAKRYGVSLEQLYAANPDIDFNEYFYPGMKIQIPSKETKTKTKKGNNGKVNKESGKNKNKGNKKGKSKEKRGEYRKEFSNNEETFSAPDVTIYIEEELVVDEKEMTSFKSPKREKPRPKDFTMIGILFGVESTALIDGPYYGLLGQYFLNNGFGATLMINSSYGTDNYGDIIIKLGPSYVYPIKKWFYVEGTLAYTLTMAHTPYHSGAVSGVALMPTLGFSFRKFKLGVNLEGSYRNGGKPGFGLFLSFGYSL